MADITPALVGKLREMTNAGLMDCKNALVDAAGDLQGAVDILRKKGQASAAKKAGREAKEGLIAQAVVNGGQVGALIEVNCETDFVARNDGFRDLIRDIAQQIAAANPRYIRREDVPEAVIAAEKEIAAAQVKDKPPQAVEKIVSGKLDKFYSTICLLEQPFVKNPEITIKDHVTAKISALGENIVIRRFVRWQLGEDTAA
jgi:elongation factor Ts